MYHAFPGHLQLGGANETFTVTLTRGEAALAVACGEGWCAVATSLGYLRVYSSTGMQLLLVTLKGPVLCMSGHGAELAVYYHTGAPWSTNTRASGGSSVSSDQNNQALVLSPQLAVEVSDTRHHPINQSTNQSINQSPNRTPSEYS